jgi:hypothetical protein
MDQAVPSFTNVRRHTAVSLITAGMLAGCASGQVPKSESASAHGATPKAADAAPEQHVAGGPVISDRIPAADRKADIHSLWAHSCDYGVYTVQENSAPTPYVVALHDDLASLPGDPWANHQITVTHYAAYINNKERLRRTTAAGLAGGLLGGLIAESIGHSASAGEKCAASEMQGGWYGSGEWTTNYNPIIVEIEATVDNRPVKVRTVYSPTMSVGYKAKAPDERAQIGNAIKKADKAFAATIGGYQGQTIASASTGSPTGASTQAVEPAYSYSSGSDVLTRAQRTASQMGCSNVRAIGDNTFAAQCSGYSVAIDCDGSQCRPTHTLKDG